MKAAVETEPVDLIETLAQRIADVCLLDARVEWARVDRAQAGCPHRRDVLGRRADDHPKEDVRSVTETPNPHIVDTDTLTGEMHPIRRAVLALGSNLGERMANLQGAVDSLADTPDVWVTGVSPVYETDPVDMPADVQAVPQRRGPDRHHAARRARCSTARWRSRTPSTGRARWSATRRAPSTST